MARLRWTRQPPSRLLVRLSLCTMPTSSKCRSSSPWTQLGLQRRNSAPREHHLERMHASSLILCSEMLEFSSTTTVCRSFSYTCAVLRKGLAIQQQVWSAERDRGQAAALYQDPEWEGMRTRLLSGLKAVHLVCTAGVVSDITSLKLGLSTLEEAREVSAVRPFRPYHTDLALPCNVSVAYLHSRNALTLHATRQ